MRKRKQTGHVSLTSDHARRGSSGLTFWKIGNRKEGYTLRGVVFSDATFSPLEIQDDERLALIELLQSTTADGTDNWND